MPIYWEDGLTSFSIVCNLFFSPSRIAFHQMGFLTTSTVVLCVLICQATNLQCKSISPSLSYWQEKLPTTPIPSVLKELVLPLSSEEIRADQVRVGLNANFQYYVNKAVGISAYFLIYHAEVYSSAGEKMAADASLTLAFLDKDLHAGKKMTLFLNDTSSPHSYFFPRSIVDKIPFSSDKLLVALENLHIPQGSDMALAMKETLRECELPALIGETKYCATSLESMIDYTTSKLGTNHVNIMVPNVVKCNSVKQQYSITAIPFESKSNSTSVICHSGNYAYGVYMCHELKDTKAVRVSLKGQDGSSGEGVAVCHRDTSQWSPEHVALKSLNLKPGGPPVCHFLPQYDLVWLAAN